MALFRRNKYRYTRSMVYDYSRVSRVQRQRRSGKTNRKIFIVSIYFFIAALFMRFAVGIFSGQEAGGFVSPAVASIQSSVDKSIKGITTIFSSGLKDTVEQSLEGTIGTYAVYIKNLRTGEQYTLNENEKFLSASLYKLWTMGAVYTQIEEGKIAKDDILQSSIESLNDKFDIASEEAELTEGSIKKTVDEAVEQMITISHNYSALLLTAKIGTSSVNQFLKEYGLQNSKVGAALPDTTAADIARFYELLYEKEIVSDIYSEEMLSRLKRQRLNDRIPKELPKETVVAHKTGELYGFKHDAGIVYAPNGDYILVMLSDSKNPAAAAERMAQLSRDVYDYFESKE